MGRRETAGISSDRIQAIGLQTVASGEGTHFVAQCLDVDVSSFGDSEDAALANLREAFELYFDGAPAGAVATVEGPESVALLSSAPKLHSSRRVIGERRIRLLLPANSHVKDRKDGSPTRTVIVAAGRKQVPRGRPRPLTPAVNIRYSRPMAKPLNSLLRDLRESNGKSLRQVAKDTGVNPAYLSRVERGEKPASSDIQRRLAAYYDVEPEIVAVASGTLPGDIIRILQENPAVIRDLRKRYGPR